MDVDVLDMNPQVSIQSRQSPVGRALLCSGRRPCQPRQPRQPGPGPGPGRGPVVQTSLLCTSMMDNWEQVWVAVVSPSAVYLPPLPNITQPGLSHPCLLAGAAEQMSP